MSNAKLIAILEKARDSYLWDGVSRQGNKAKFVCYAINAAAGGTYTGLHMIPKKLEKLVASHLHGRLSMNSFLASQFSWSKVDRMSNKTVQTYRFMMVNNMIKLLKEEMK